MDFKSKYDVLLEKVSNALDEYIVEKDTPEKAIYSAMRYSLLAGGKRLRPVLSLAVCDMLGGDLKDVLPYACAIEMIHTYSLIHDDLPAMDNDDYRRGMLTNHKVYGEAIAILAGDALLNSAFELMLNYTVKSGNNIVAKTEAMSLIAKAAGAQGMIGGQVVDLESEGKIIAPDRLEYMHRCKTGALIKAPVLSAAIICGAIKAEYDALKSYAENIGLAFQIKDDILDVEGNSEEMGKPAGSDEANNKSTFITLFGLEESKRKLDDVTQQAVEVLNVFGEKSEFLKELAYYLVKRQN